MEDDYAVDDFNFDLLAGIYAEQDRITAEDGEQAGIDYIFDNVMTIGASVIELEAKGYTNAEINAEIHMRRYTGQGFTTIRFGNACKRDKDE